VKFRPYIELLRWRWLVPPLSSGEGARG